MAGRKWSMRTLADVRPRNSAVNSRVRYMKEEHGGAHLTTPMRRLLLFMCGGDWGGGEGSEEGKTRRCEILLRDQPSIEELCNRNMKSF